MINEIKNQNENRNYVQFKSPIQTSNESIFKKITKNTPSMQIRVLQYSIKRGNQNLFVVASDMLSIIRKDVQNSMLQFKIRTMTPT